MAKSPSHGRDMGALYLIFWRRNYPHDRGTRPSKGILAYSFPIVVQGPARPDRSLYTHLFLQPPYFIAHAFPEVGSLGGCPMALDVVPPGHRDECTGEHDHGDVPVQDRNAPVNKLFEFCGV